MSSFHTRLVQFDACPDDPHCPINTPIYQTTTFQQSSGAIYDYSRSGNPTRRVLENQLARLENGTRGFAYSSGMAAITAVTSLVDPGEGILAGVDIYGGTYRLLKQVLEPKGVKITLVDTSDLRALDSAIRTHHRMILLETPSNPLQEVTDLAQVARIAHSRGLRLAVDNSLLSPYLQNPLDLGADIVIHSATKYLCGHADVTAGAVVVADPGLGEKLAFAQNATGGALGPFESWLLINGIKTLAVRLDRQQQTAEVVANWLGSFPSVEKVYFPGLSRHPGKSVHDRQARGPGAVISFEVTSEELAEKLLEETKLFATTVSFGSVTSSIERPAAMSHASIVESGSGSISGRLLRISIGLEDPDDLVSDLGGAFGAALPQMNRRAPMRRPSSDLQSTIVRNETESTAAGRTLTASVGGSSQ